MRKTNRVLVSVTQFLKHDSPVLIRRHDTPIITKHAVKEICRASASQRSSANAQFFFLQSVTRSESGRVKYDWTAMIRFNAK